ncbi:hypothetical protein [Streptomyces chattanoogensis]|uniref:hypothetical protein n=1 Tax=Streptomyces chattanoogensis TaxID=66876 RepID=UPI0012FF4C92|nr:hypothetical protein [Streptomyces chattanoogensis]
MRALLTASAAGHGISRAVATAVSSGPHLLDEITEAATADAMVSAVLRSACDVDYRVE